MSLDSEVKALQQVPMFTAVEPSRLKLLAFASERVTFASGQSLFRQGDPSDSAYVILEGAAHVMLETPKGQLKVAELKRDAIVGEMGAITDARRSATILAADDIVALRIPKDVFQHMLYEFPQMSFAVIKDLALRLERTNAQLAARSGS